jgi:hypothetical protein
MILWNYTLICEKVSDDVNRLILFDTDEDTGAKYVVDIVEADDIKILSTWFSDKINDKTYATFVLGPQHDNVDLGRAVKMETKIRKVLESL